LDCGRLQPSFGFNWLKDGTKLAFTSSRALDGSDTSNTNSVVNIWVLNADGSGKSPSLR